MLQEDDVLPSQRGRRLKGEGQGIERNARGAPRVSLAPKTPFPPLSNAKYVLPRATEPLFLSALHAKNGTTYLFGYTLGESTENNKALLFLSSKETVQTFNGSI